MAVLFFVANVFLIVDTVYRYDLIFKFKYSQNESLNVEVRLYAASNSNFI